MSRPGDRPSQEILAGQFEAFVRGDLDGLLAHWQPDGTFRDMAEPGPRVGHDELRAYMAENMERMDDIDARFTALVGDGERALAEIVMECTWRGEGAAREGVHVTLSFCVVDVIRDGLVQHETVYWNPQLLDDQLAAASSPARLPAAPGLAIEGD